MAAPDKRVTLTAGIRTLKGLGYDWFHVWCHFMDFFAVTFQDRFAAQLLLATKAIQRDFSLGHGVSSTKISLYHSKFEVGLASELLA